MNEVCLGRERFEKMRPSRSSVTRKKTGKGLLFLRILLAVPMRLKEGNIK